MDASEKRLPQHVAEADLRNVGDLASCTQGRRQNALCSHTHTHRHTHTHTPTHTHTHPHTHTHIYIYIYIYTHLHTHTPTHIYTPTPTHTHSTSWFELLDGMLCLPDCLFRTSSDCGNRACAHVQTLSEQNVQACANPGWPMQ